jgi:hypothetical protein
MTDLATQEHLLGAMIAAAKSRGLGWCKGMEYRDRDGCRTGPEDAVTCCAVGAMHLEGLSDDAYPMTRWGNDFGYWLDGDADDGESLGWAFRQAMTEDDSV